jgi:hypothetical protein
VLNRFAVVVSAIIGLAVPAAPAFGAPAAGGALRQYEAETSRTELDRLVQAGYA